jgi:hypothetical protein
MRGAAESGGDSCSPGNAGNTAFFSMFRHNRWIGSCDISSPGTVTASPVVKRVFPLKFVLTHNKYFNKILKFSSL